jgi:hypothetical protein
MGPLLALVVIGLILIGLVGAIFGGLNLVFQTIFTYFPYFVALVILGYLVTKFGGSRGNRMSEAEAGTLGAIGGAAASEIGDRIGGGGGGPDTTPTSPPDSTPSSTGDDSSSSDSGDNIVQQQQQQMQELILALLEGNLGQGGGDNFVAYGPQQQQQQMLGGLSPGVYSTFLRNVSMADMSQQVLMEQLIQFMYENNYQEINNEVIMNFMKQVLDIDIDEGDVSEGDIIVQINHLIQQIDIDQKVTWITQIVDEINVTNRIYVEQFTEILIAIEDRKFEREGDVIIIYAHEEIRINSATLMTFLNILQVIKYWELKQLLIALIEMPQDTNWEVKIEKLIVVFREGGKEDDSTSDEADAVIFQIEDVQSQINDILSQIRQSENLEEKSIQDKRDAIEKLRDAFQRLQDNPEILKAISIAADANAGQEEGSQALATAIQRGLNDTDMDITDVASKAQEIDGVWREIAEAERLVKDSFDQDLTVYKSLNQKEYNMDEIAEMHKRFKKGINQLQKLD